MATPLCSPHRRDEYIALSLMYFAQGLPVGLAFNALGVLIRDSGHALADVGLTGLAFLPWALKILWAGPVDNACMRFGHARMIAVMQAAMIVLCLALAQVSIADELAWVIAGIVLLNTISATQDIVTNAYAVQRLQGRAAGPANAIQVGGFILGMLAGGGGLLMVHAAVGWDWSLRLVAGMLLATYVPLLLRKAWMKGASDHHPSERVLLRDIARHRDLGWALGLGLLFKFAGTALATLMQPWLIDAGMTPAAIGRLQIVILIANVLGGVLIGMPLLRAMGDRKALLTALAGSTLALGVAPVLIATGITNDNAITLAFAGEGLVDGAMYVCIWAFVMNWASPERPGTDFTALQCCESLANALAAGTVAGLGAQLGYARAFAAIWLAGLGAAIFIAFALPRIRLNGEGKAA